MNNWTDLDKRAIKALHEQCTFLPGSYNKRFAGGLYWTMRQGKPVTDNQLANMWRLVFRYRRQHQDRELTEHAYAGLAVEALVEWMRGVETPLPLHSTPQGRRNTKAQEWQRKLEAWNGK